MFDSKFQLITPPAGAPVPFADPQLPAGWAPFNVMNLNGRVFVMEAKQGVGGDEEKGAGLGAIAVFDANGAILSRITSNLFNAPWGAAIVPASSTLTDGIDTLFVGNFGDGRITRFDASSFREIGQIGQANDPDDAIDGLWGIVVGSAEAGNPNALYVVAGPADETAGLYARIERATDTN